MTGPSEAVTAVEFIDVRGELSRAAGSLANKRSVATLLSISLVCMPGVTLAGPALPTAVEGSIAGGTPIADAVDSSEDSGGSHESGASKYCGDEADFVVSSTPVESSTTGAASRMDPIDASGGACGSARFGVFEHCGDDADPDVSPARMEGSIAPTASAAEDTMHNSSGSGEFGGSKSCVDCTDIDVSVGDAPGVNGWIDDSRTEVGAGTESLRCSADEPSLS
jgi:hypothetical protein